jgi:hypothetical protein
MSFGAAPTLKGMKKTYRGSCHCGTIRFECELDLAEGTTRCNCSFCRKARFWMAFAKSPDFRITAGSEELSDYQHTPAGKTEPFLHLYFCKKCGVRAFTKGGFLPAFNSDFYAVNLGCLDDATDEELAQAKISFANGRADDWSRECEATRYL